MLGRFRRPARQRRFVADAGALNLSFGALFAYISASSFLLEDIYHTSPQLYSLIFALLAAAFVVVAQVGGRLVAGSARGAVRERARTSSRSRRSARS